MPKRHIFGILVFLLLLSANTVVAQSPELVVQTGHANGVSGFAFSPDDRYLISGGETVVIWDVGTGREVRNLPSDATTARKNSLVVSKDGRILALGKQTRLWDGNTGEEIKVPNVTNSVTIRPDGKMLAYLDLTKIVLFDLQTGRADRTLPMQQRYADMLLFSPNGEILAVPSGIGGKDYKVSLWDTRSAKVNVEFSVGSLGPDVIAFSPDGKTLATGDTDSVRLWNVDSGKLVRKFKSWAKSLSFSPDGRTLAIGNSGYGIELWDIQSGKIAQQFPGQEQRAVYSSDGRLLAIAHGLVIELWDAATGVKIRELTGHSQRITADAITPDGRYLATGSQEGEVILWDLKQGSEPRGLIGGQNYINNLGYGRISALAFSPDGRRLAAGGGYETVGELTVWDVETGIKLFGLNGEAFTEVNSVSFSEDGKTIVTWHGTSRVGAERRSLNFWDAETGARRRTVGGDFAQVGNEHYDGIVFSPARNAFAAVTASAKGRAIEIWGIDAAQKLRQIDDAGIDRYSSYPVAFSADGNLFARATTSQNGAYEIRTEVRIWEIRTGVSQSFIVAPGILPTAITFNSDGSKLAIRCSFSVNYKTQEVIQLLDLKTRSIANTISNTNGWTLRSVLFSPDGRILIASGINTSLTLLDTTSGAVLASLIAVNEREWLVTSPDGLFDGSTKAWTQTLWRFSKKTSDVAPVEAYFKEFFYPGLLPDLISGKRPKVEIKIEKLDRRQPSIQVVLAEPLPTGENQIATHTVKLKIRVAEKPPDDAHPSGSGVRDVRLFRNGSLVKTWHGDVLSAFTKAEMEFAVPIIAGENDITAYGFNNDNIKSADATLVIKGSDVLNRKGTAYVLAIGVNQYSNKEFDLKYAVPDARSFGEEFQRAQSGLGNFAKTEVITLVDLDATKANILRALNRLAGQGTEPLAAGDPLEKIRPTQPEDAVIVYFSGHGTADENRFYLIPHDMGYLGRRDDLGKDETILQSVVKNSVSDAELEQAFEKIDASQLLLVIDACHSGQALESEEKRRGPMNSRGLAQLAYEKGMYILTAAESYQVAIGSRALGHGFLTYALVEEGLKTNKADTSPGDGKVLIREWLDYATKRVPEMQQDKAAEIRELVHPAASSNNNASEKYDVQRPRVFYRREAETRPLVVVKP